MIQVLIMSTQAEIAELYRTYQGIVSAIEFYPHYEFESLLSLLFSKYDMIHAVHIANVLDNDWFNLEETNAYQKPSFVNMYHQYIDDTPARGQNETFCTLDNGYFIVVYFPTVHTEQAKVIKTNIDGRKLKSVTNFLNAYNTEFPLAVARHQEKVKSVLEEIAILETYAEVLGDE